MPPQPGSCCYLLTVPHAWCQNRPISDPVGALFGASSVVKAAAKAAADAALADLVKGLRRRGPAAKSDTSLSAALSRLSSAGGVCCTVPLRLLNVVIL